MYGMDKTEAIKRAGSGAALARILGVTRSYVSKWGDAIPELMLFRLKARKPRWFRK